ncbi:response regulator [Candidatus Omnitrophota bacterium]
METKKTILVIDDEADLVKILKFRLEQKGYNVLTAYDGAAGLQIADESKPHLIILDISMPKMSGIEFYDKICDSDKKPRFPILVLTARGELRDLFKSINVDGFMTKPFKAEHLNREVEIILKKRYEKPAEKEPKVFDAPKKVLIVEDNKETFDKLVIAFLNAGYVVNSAKSGIATIEKVMADLPDLIVINLGLSDLPGDLVVAKLRQMPKTMDIPFVLYVSNGGQLDLAVTEKICKRVGLKNLTESNDPGILLEKAEAVLQESGT